MDNGMKKRRIIIAMTAAAALSFTSAGLADLYYRMLLERALFLMEARLKPENAITIFREIVNRHPDDRYFAARAQYYIGLCYLRMKSEQALPSFLDVVMNYPDQRDVVKMAMAELASLSKSQPKPAPPQELEEQSVRRVWRGKSVYGTNSISQDGRHVSFVDHETGGLALCDLAKGQTRYLTGRELDRTLAEYAHSVVISPDARKIAYGWQNKTGGSELRVVGIDGARDRVILSDKKIVSIRPAAWTVDSGQILACLLRADLTAQMIFVSVSDGTVRPVKEMGFQWPYPLKLSPNGYYVAYGLLQDQHSPDRDIFLYDLKEKTETPLVVQPGDDLFLDWTPDGKNILYASHQAGITDAWILAVRQGKPLQPARLLRSDIGQIHPVGFTRNGSFYFEERTGRINDSNAGRNTSEMWVLEGFLPHDTRTLTVPDDYPTIQAAIFAANPGDIVYVRKGVYAENVSIGKSLTLQGEDRTNTVIKGSGQGSVVHITASYVLVRGLTVTNGKWGVEITSGVPIHHVTLKDLNVILNSVGIFSYRTGGYHVIEECIISKSREYALNAHQFSRSLIRNCEVFDNTMGLRPAWSWYIRVEGNKIHHNHGSGVYLDSCYYSTVERNLVYKNIGAAISATYISTRNTVRENILFNNSTGISLGLAWGGFGENRIYHNDMIDNPRQVSAFGDSVRFQYWDNGPLLGGNFWSGYRGPDANRDGIGDTPYPMIPEGRDRFPLVKPRNKVEATLDLDPGWPGIEDRKDRITAYIELPAGLPVEDIDASTLLLNNAVSPERAQISIGDHDNDGVADLTVRFSIGDASRILKPGEDVALTVSGKLKNGLPFEGRRLLKAIGK